MDKQEMKDLWGRVKWADWSSSVKEASKKWSVPLGKRFSVKFGGWVCVQLVDKTDETRYLHDSLYRDIESAFKEEPLKLTADIGEEAEGRMIGARERAVQATFNKPQWAEQPSQNRLNLEEGMRRVQRGETYG